MDLSKRNCIPPHFFVKKGRRHKVDAPFALAQCMNHQPIGSRCVCGTGICCAMPLLFVLGALLSSSTACVFASRVCTTVVVFEPSFLVPVCAMRSLPNLE